MEIFNARKESVYDYKYFDDWCAAESYCFKWMDFIGSIIAKSISIIHLLIILIASLLLNCYFLLVVNSLFILHCLPSK